MVEAVVRSGGEGGDSQNRGGVFPIQDPERSEQRLRVRAELGMGQEGRFQCCGVEAPHRGAGVQTWFSDQEFLIDQEFARLQEFTHF